eukprot:299499_1
MRLKKTIRSPIKSKTPTLTTKKRKKNNNMNSLNPFQSDIVVDNKNGVTFQNYTITTFFKRRLSKQQLHHKRKRNIQNAIIVKASTSPTKHRNNKNIKYTQNGNGNSKFIGNEQKK